MEGVTVTDRSEGRNQWNVDCKLHTHCTQLPYHNNGTYETLLVSKRRVERYTQIREGRGTRADDDVINSSDY